MKILHGYFSRIAQAQAIISNYGTNPILTKNSLKGLEELKKDFINELLKQNQEYKRGD